MWHGTTGFKERLRKDALLQALALELDGPHVGLGPSLCLEAEDDESQPFEAQCCLTRPGKGEVILTSALGINDILRQCVGLMHQFI